MNEWYYSDAGQQRGPVSFDELRQRAASGRLNAVSDLVWNSTMTSWQPAGQVPGIFDSTGASPFPSSNPYAAPLSQDLSAPLAAGILPMIPPGSQPPDAMACISRAFTLTNRNLLNLLSIGVVYVIVTFAISFLIGWLSVPSAVTSSSGTYYTTTAQPSVVSSLVPLLSNIVTIFLQLGFLRVGLNVVSGGPIAVSQLFGEGRKLLRAIGASILFFIAVIIGLVLLIVPGIYIAIRLGPYLTVITDRDLGIVDSLKYTWELTRNSVLPIILLGIISALLVFAGALLLGIGLIYAMPVVSIAVIVLYRWLQYGPVAVQDEPGMETPVLRRIL